MTSHKDEQLLQDIVRNFHKCRSCSSPTALLLPDDRFDGEKEPPRGGQKVGIQHRGLKCSECDYELPYERAKFIYSYEHLHRQLFNVCSKFTNRHIFFCCTCKKRLLVDSFYFCRKCLGNAGAPFSVLPERDLLYALFQASQCAHCAIRDHPGGEEHCLESGVNMGRPWSVWIAHHLYEMTKKEAAAETPQMVQIMRARFGFPAEETSEVQRKVEEVEELKNVEMALLVEKIFMAYTQSQQEEVIEEGETDGTAEKKVSTKKKGRKKKSKKK
ncbi:hypothetical protein QR680_005009 [Steinernema hermaphroditum]|uniref:Uncharacterized protein n=1 Tax=Steinernema hermaphroditum TaxID=289476 RepID=A0AA39HQI9_9BILA|nr:hypothetical protein QR680_005009 [Steinernema hermaphroditum]